MAFPEAHRVIYRKNPLEQVICQLRFPTILRIESEPPADLQERVRSEFPAYSENVEFAIDAGLPAGVPAPVIALMKQLPAPKQSKNHGFESEDGNWKINLTPSFIALTSRDYHRWEEFRAKLNCPVNALQEIYKPTYYTRIGLRYIDVLRRSNFDLGEIKWRKLLKPNVLGALGDESIGEEIQQLECKYEIQLPDDKGSARMITKLVLDEQTHEQIFIIDSDFMKEGNIRQEDVLELLNHFNKQASRLMRWCITDDLHHAMEPEELK